MPEQGAFFQPLLMTDISDDNDARYWEFFGPVTQLYRAKDEDDAIRIANDSPFGLGGSVYTADHQRGVEVAKKSILVWFTSIAQPHRRPTCHLVV